ncbi:hypothetical protein [Burkholderia oklahomensis]|uniref:hypothetical protein n=2 Tax=Burkholderia oklahomensis TaxID=342113 RepID=UPI0002FC3634|nr:hypothetical protein [Burkholderia oklahomensis]
MHAYPQERIAPNRARRAYEGIDVVSFEHVLSSLCGRAAQAIGAIGASRRAPAPVECMRTAIDAHATIDRRAKRRRRLAPPFAVNFRDESRSLYLTPSPRDGACAWAARGRPASATMPAASARGPRLTIEAIVFRRTP